LLHRAKLGVQNEKLEVQLQPYPNVALPLRNFRIGTTFSAASRRASADRILFMDHQRFGCCGSSQGADSIHQFIELIARVTGTDITNGVLIELPARAKNC